MQRFQDMTTQSVNYGADVRRRVINVDAAYREVPSTYRDNPSSSNDGGISNFLFKLTTPVRNVSAFRVTSVELTNVTFAGNYALLQINDESSIESKGPGGTEIRGVAKILARPVLAGTNAAILLGDTFGLISNTVTFRSPQDITTLRVKLVNPDGTTMADAGSGKVAFTLELDEVLNSHLYESRRKHIGWNPANL